MTSQVLIVLILTFLINLITTLSYSVRIVGIRTGRIAISFALFNILVVISRTANGFQAPLLAKTVENDIAHGIFSNTEAFRYVIFSCTLATVVGALLIPTFQRVLSRAVINFSEHKSVPRLLLHSFSKAGILYFRDNLTLPARQNLTQLGTERAFPWKIFLLNVAGKCAEATFRRYIVYMTLARLLGTLLAQLLFLPGAELIALLATKL